MAGGKIDILIEPDMKNFGSKLESGLKGTLGTVGKLGAAFGVALGGTEIVRQIGQIGVSFDQQMNTMSAVSQATASQLDAVRAKAMELGTDTSLTATSAGDAAAAMTELAKGGFTVEQAMTAAKGTLQLASAAQVDAATAATIQSQALQAFSLSASDAGRVSDILAGAANASSAEMTDVAQALQQAGTVSQQFGVSIDDTATAIAMFANAGITGSDAGTLLKSAMLALTDQGAPAQAAIRELGLEVYNSQGQFVGLESLMQQLNDAAGRMSDEQYQAATATLFGSDAMRLAGIAADKSGQDFAKLRDAVTRQGQAAEVAAAQTKGMPGAVERMSNAFESAAVQVYQAVDDKIVAGMDKATGAMEQLAPVAASALGGIATTAGVAADALTPAIGLVTDLAGAVMGLPAPVLTAGAALAGANWLGFPDRMSAASKVTGGFIEHLGDLRIGASDTQAYFAKAGEEISKFEAGMVLAGTSSNATLRAIGTGYTNSGQSIAAWADKHKEAAASAKQMALTSTDAFTSIDLMGQQMAHGFASGVGKMGTATAKFTGGALGGLKTGLGGLVSFLGGPWGLAFAGAGLVIGSLIQKHQEAAAAEEEHRATQQALKDTLDATNGSITAQTEALVQKQLEESGAAAGARQAGLAQSTLVDAANGDTSARQQVMDATRSSLQTDVENSAAWKYRFWIGNDVAMKNASVDAQTYTDALLGIPEAIQKIDDAGFTYVLDHIRESVEGGGNSVSALGMEMGKLNRQMDGAKADHLTDSINQARETAENTTEVFSALGETIFTMPDEATILVGADQNLAQTTIDQINEIGAGIEAVRNTDGSVTISLPEGQNVLETLQAIGADLQKIEDNGEQYIQIGNNAPEVQAMLSALGIQTQQLPNGDVVIASNTSEEQAKLIQLGILVKDDKTGKLTISSNLDSILKKQHQLESRNGTQTTQTHTVYERTVRSVEYANSAGGTQRLPLSMQADGSVRTAANGLLSQQQAQIAPGGAWVMWAEDETEGESFIPHAPSKRKRSTQILAETASIFGLGLVDARGVAVARDGSNLDETGRFFADGAVRLKSAAQIKKDMAFLDGTPYVLGGWSASAVDCSGGVSATVNSALGLPVFDSRMSTVTAGSWLAAKGAAPGRGSAGDIIIGWWDQGGGANGHTAMQLQDGTYVESGGNTGGGYTIGRTAGPLDGRGFTNWAHFRGDGTRSDTTESQQALGGMTLTDSSGSRKSVSWGSAQSTKDLVAALMGSTGLYDNGGWLMPGGFAYNATSQPEAIMSQSDRQVALAQATAVTAAANSLPDLASAMRLAAKSLDDAAGEMAVTERADVEKMLEAPSSPQEWMADLSIALKTAAGNYEKDPAGYALQLGGTILPEVFGGLADAETALKETRAQGRQDLEAVTLAEEELAEARKELAKAEAEGGGMSTSYKRKLEDAEKDVADARAGGNASQIASAELKLKHAREDAAEDIEKNNSKNAEAVKKASETVSEAELNLSDARTAASQVAGMVAGAEVTMALEVAKTIYAGIKWIKESVEKVVDWVTDKINAVRGARADAIAGISEVFTSLASAVDSARDQLSALSIQMVNDRISQEQAMWSVEQARAAYTASQLSALVKVSEAQKAMDAHTLANVRVLGTSIDDLHARLIIGLDSGTLTFEEAIDDVAGYAAEKMALEADKNKAFAEGMAEQKAAALDFLDASREAAKAALNAQSSTKLLAAQAEQLKTMTTSYNGLSTPEATKLEYITQLIKEAAEWDAKDKKEILVEESRRYEAARDQKLSEANRLMGEWFGDDPEKLTQWKQELDDIVDRAGHYGFWGNADAITAMIETSSFGQAALSQGQREVEQKIADYNKSVADKQVDVAAAAIDAQYTPEELKLRQEQASWDQQASYFDAQAQYYRSDNTEHQQALLSVMEFSREETTRIADFSEDQAQRLSTLAGTAKDIYDQLDTYLATQGTKVLDITIAGVEALPPSLISEADQKAVNAALWDAILTQTDINTVATKALDTVDANPVSTRYNTREDAEAKRRARDEALAQAISNQLADARTEQALAQALHLNQQQTHGPISQIILPGTEIVATDDVAAMMTELQNQGHRIEILEGNTAATYFATRT